MGSADFRATADGIVTLWLDNQKRANAPDDVMTARILDELGELASSPACRVEVWLGIPATMTAVSLARAVSGKAAAELLFTGRRITPEQSFELGLISQLCPPDRLDDDWAALGAELTAGSPGAILACKALLRKTAGFGLAAALDAAAAVSTHTAGSPDAHEGMAAFREKRKPLWASLSRNDTCVLIQ